jgi:hypothetical protein
MSKYPNVLEGKVHRRKVLGIFFFRARAHNYGEKKCGARSGILKTRPPVGPKTKKNPPLPAGYGRVYTLHTPAGREGYEGQKKAPLFSTLHNNIYAGPQLKALANFFIAPP